MFTRLALVAGLLAVSVPAAAQDGDSCKQSFEDYSVAFDRLLDAAIHGEADYDAVNTQDYQPAYTAALAACRMDGRAKQTVYNTNAKVTSFTATRDLAIAMLQRDRPVPNN